ncbi:biotin/lipoyl-containing protein [Salinarimonas rosea]|uniref:biotin/lipoyl-containing protein n=1 Tax=Salinarimonas rosea TaxID=552063 RepID=UPI0003FB9F62|nr:biotin/lipoyl-containing protein [Salinarimonas rosea]
MPHEVIMPALGMAQDTGHLVAWRKEAGDRVCAGDVLMEIETDKSTVEVEAGADGWVTELRARAGDDVPVGRVVAVIGETPEAQATAPAATSGPAPAGEAAPEGDPVIMPALGMAQDTGLIVAWAKAPGDPVAAGEVLLEVETDKSTLEIEAQSSGFVAEIRAAAGASVPVGEVIAVISAEKPTAPRGPGEASATPKAEPAAKPAPTPAPAPAAAPVPAAFDGRVLASPKARRLASERGLDLARLVAEGAGQPIHVRDLDALAARAAAARSTVPAASPAAAPAAVSQAARLEARAPAAGLEAFTAWLAAENGGASRRTAVLAAFATAGLRAGRDDAQPLVVAVETADGADPVRYADADRARLGTLAPSTDASAPVLVVRDLLGTPIVAARAGGLAAPVLTLVPAGGEIALSLDYAADALDDRAAVALVTALAARLAEPLHHLL